MSIIKKAAAAAMVMAFSASAQAAVLDLSGLVGGANIYTIGDFTSNSSDVEGSVVVGGNLKASSYSINENNRDAFATNGNGYALVVHGNVDYSNGSIKNGLYYAGSGTLPQSVGTPGASSSANSPLSFSSVSAAAIADSKALAKLAETGSSNINGNAMVLTGTGSGVQVFKLTTGELSSFSDFQVNNIANGSTIVIDVSGTTASFRDWGIELKTLQNYNVVYNFSEATTLTLRSVGVYGSILAPYATVLGENSAQVNGTVIVGAWNSSVQINSNHYFVATDIPNLQLAPAVPEPEAYAMLLAGLGLMGAVARRRRQK